jgi:hypothetical protein
MIFLDSNPDKKERIITDIKAVFFKIEFSLKHFQDDGTT